MPGLTSAFDLSTFVPQMAESMSLEEAEKRINEIAKVMQLTICASDSYHDHPSVLGACKLDPSFRIEGEDYH